MNKKPLYLSAAIGSLLLANSSFADVADRDGVYDLSCDSSTLLLTVSAGTGSTTESSDSILLTVEGEQTQLIFPAGCDSEAVPGHSTELWITQIKAHCEQNYEIPENSGITCESLANSITEWGLSLQDTIGKPEINQYYADIDPPSNWFMRWLGAHPSTIELSRVDGTVKANNTYTFNSGSFDFSLGVRNAIVGGIAGFGCIGGITDFIDGQVVELEDASYFGYAEEDNTAGIVCTKDQGDERFAVALNFHLETHYSGPNISGN